MGSETRQEKVRTVVATCKDRWRSSGVPEDRAEEMGEELEQHLQGSLTDGQSVGDVIGDNLFDFAEEWAASNQPRKPIGHEVLEMLSATSVFMFLSVLVMHLWLGSARLPVSWEALSFLATLAFVFTILFARLRRPSGVEQDTEVSVWDVYPTWLRVGILSFIVLMFAYDKFLQSTEQVVFTWPATAALLVASPVPLLLKKMIRGEPMGASREQWDDEYHHLHEVLEPRDEIELVVKDCVFYWKTDTRIPLERAKEMGTELEQHLWDAVQDNKTVESVVGHDVESFAEEWAEEDRPSASALDRAIEIVFAVSAFFTFAAGLAHLLGWTLYVPVLWFLVLFLIGVGSWSIQKVVERARRPQTGSLRKSWISTAAVAVLAFGLAGGIALAIFGVQERVPLLTSLQWPWYATLISAASSLLMLFLWIKE